MLQSVTLFGITINPYDLFNNLGTVASILVGFYVVRSFRDTTTLSTLANMHFNKKKKNTFFWRWGFIILIFAVILIVTTVIDAWTGRMISMLFLGNKDANFFPNIYVAPVVFFMLAILLRLDPIRILDAAAPVDAVALIFYKLACFCYGCCNGVECSGGMMNMKTGRVEVPIQLIEAACAVVMFAVLMLLFIKKNYKTGLLYPLFMIMYCASRFISEFWRDDYPDIFGPLKSYHIQCLIGLAQGIVFLVIVLIWGDRISAYFNRKNAALIERHEEKLQKEREKKRAAHANKKKHVVKKHGKKK